MTNFKLIAITPLADCDESYRKKLPAGEPNIFYKGYDITLTKDKKEVLRVDRPANPVPADLYQLQNGISLSISAIVGKNGSGKSTLFELFFYAIYAIYTEKKISGRPILTKESEDTHDFNRKLAEGIQLLTKWLPHLNYNPIETAVIWEEILPNFMEFVKSNRIEFKSEDYLTPYSLVQSAIKTAKLKYDDSQKHAKILEEEESAIKSGLAVSIIYESDDIVRELLYDHGIFRHSVFNPKRARDQIIYSIEDFRLEDLFYTICVNYSHHGLNSNFIGTWINKLFHKNDAYITPIVINPMRHEGNFDINREQHLAKERLMANILYDLINHKEEKLLGKYSVTEFVFSVKTKSTPLLYPFELEKLKAYPLLQNIGIDNSIGYVPFFDYAISYLENKIEKIYEQYHFIIYDLRKGKSQEDQLKQFLLEDDSHITKKIRQTLNFLEQSLKHKKFWESDDDVQKVLSHKEMAQWLSFFTEPLEEHKPYELIEYGLPGFFHIDFVLKRENSKPILFSSLSSGEQQSILNINSILYHLYNLNSVQIQDQDDQNEVPNENYGRVSYRDVNIILDEVELYYHPEMQRRVVSELISGFEKIKHKSHKGIRGINVTILTHSPFILSDIPHQNVLSMTDEKSKPLLSESTKTFGGNIHEILMEQFFMDSTMGEHSIKIIQDLISIYESARQADSEEQIKRIRADYESAKQRYKFVVENVGEDVISEILRNNLDYIEFVISEN